MYNYAKEKYDEMFPVEARQCYETVDLGRVDGERIYTECLDAVVTDAK